MSERTEAVISFLATLLVLFSAMLDPRISGDSCWVQDSPEQPKGDLIQHAYIETLQKFHHYYGTERYTDLISCCAMGRLWQPQSGQNDTAVG